MRFISTLFLSVLVAWLLSGCGGGGGGSTTNGGGGPNNSVSAATLKGQAVKGPISNGTVTAYAVTASGTKGASLGSTTTDTGGNYSFTVNYSGPLLLEITNGSYLDEANGQTVNVPTTAGSGLQAVIDNVTAGSTLSAQITPLTSMATALAQAMTGGLTASNITAANQQVSSHFGGIDILNTQPINSTVANSATGATQSAIDYALILAGISEEAKTLGITNPFDLVTALVQDFSDGTFNGESGSTSIQLAGAAMNPATGTTQLSTAISAFSANTSLNHSGGTVSSTLVSSISGSTNTFTALTATMTTGRAFHTATLLPNGKVLITGGINNSSLAALNTAEIYDPVLNAFTALNAKMTSVRDQHTATLLPDGKVLLTGGQNQGNGDGMSTAEIYDPNSQTFSTITATMTTPRGDHTATLLPNGKVLITGGFNNSADHLNTAELYDPVANTFTAVTTTMITARASHTATLLPSGQVLLTGGQSLASKNGGVPLNSAELYDPVANHFTALTTTMTTARFSHTATLLPDGQVLLTGGCVDSCTPSSLIPSNTVEVYDPVANTFIALDTTMTTARFAHTATLLFDDRVLFTGGGNSTASSFSTLNTAEVYNALPLPAETVNWSAVAPMLQARDQFTGGVINGKIYVFGGNGDPDAVNLKTTEVYDPASNQWSALASNEHNGGQGVEEVTSAVLNGKLYVFGGYGGGTSNGIFNFNEEYDPATDTWRSLAPKPVSVSGANAVAYKGEIYIFNGNKEGTGQSSNVVEAYNPTTNSWRTVTTTPVNLGSAAIAVVGDLAYLIGGIERDLDRTFIHIHANVIAYNFVTNQWITTGLGTMPDLVHIFPYSSAAPIIDGKVFLLGGLRVIHSGTGAITVSDVETSDTVYVYDPVTNEFSILEALPKATSDNLSLALGNEIYMMGGITDHANQIRTNAVWKGEVTAK